MAHEFLGSVLSTHNRRRLGVVAGALFGMALTASAASAQGPWRDGESAADCNQNEIPDYIEIQLGLVADDNNDGIPDECQDPPDQSTPGHLRDAEDPPGLGDCNGNGTPDLIDIWAGTSPDKDQDGVPDECQVLAASSPAAPFGRRALLVGREFVLQGPSFAAPLGRVQVVEEFAVEGPTGWRRLWVRRDATDAELLQLMLGA